MRVYVNPLIYVVLILAQLYFSQASIFQLTGEDKPVSKRYWLIFSCVTFIIDIVIFDYYKTNVRSIVIVMIATFYMYFSARSTVVKAFIQGSLMFVVTIFIEFIAQFIFLPLELNILEHYVVFYGLNIVLLAGLTYVSKALKWKLFDISKVRF